MAGPTSIVWLAGRLELTISIDQDGHAFLRSILPVDTVTAVKSLTMRDCALPLAEIKLSGESNQKETSKRHVHTYVSRRMVYLEHKERIEEGVRFLDVTCYDPLSKTTVIVHYSAFPDVAVIRSWVEIKNSSDVDVTLRMVSSIVFSGFTSPEWWKNYRVSLAHNTWFREAQWQTMSLPSVGLDDLGIISLGHEASQSCFAVTSQGSFSTGGNLPMGALTRNDGKQIWLWQIEHNGPWRWEIGDFRDSMYMFASGPTDQDHQWSVKLAPGDTFHSATTALCVLHDDLYSGFSEMTRYRRELIRPHEDNDRMSVIFNDYMNCLMGDPTDEKLEALIKPVAESGAEYFCIDAGWYADSYDWWPSVGDWKPSTTRFKSGLKAIIMKIRDAGMIPGLWMEPEVVGITSDAVNQLPRDIFFQRDGQRILEKDRYHLDFSHPAVIERMTSIVEGLVSDLGVGYFKFDYNTNMPFGTDTCGRSPGQGQLDHGRAYLKWVRGLLDRNPKLVIENCGSGGQRMDYAMLSVLSLQSTSDQQDPVRYAAIAASIASAVTPEQGATWAYPQPEWSDELNAFTVVNSLLGRVHLSGRVDLLNEHQHKLVTEGISVYKSIRNDLRRGIPFWPLGIPKWSDEWCSVGSKCTEKVSYVSVWRRSGSTSTICLPIHVPRGTPVKVSILYPKELPTQVSWQDSPPCVVICLAEAPSARLIKLEF